MGRRLLGNLLPRLRGLLPISTPGRLMSLLRRLDEEPPEKVEASDEFLLFQLKVHAVDQALRQRATALVDKLDKMSRQDEAGKKLVERLRREKTAGPKPWSEKHYGKEAMEFLLESHTFYVSVQNEKASMEENTGGPSAPGPAPLPLWALPPPLPSPFLGS